MMDQHTLERVLDREQERFLAEWKEFLRFPSVSTDPAHQRDCAACATWLVDHLGRMGFEARLLSAESHHPVVFAERRAGAGRPTVLFYGHYDVQPPDPLEEWLSKPFEPELRDGRLYGRGAQDNKGQLLYVLKAAEALLKANALDVNLKIVIEGEEESGSQGIAEGLPGWKELLQADVLMVTDTEQVRTGQPTIVMGLRGVIHLTVTLSGPKHDLHSGTHGGVAPNPATAMARLIATLHRDTGSIVVAGFYDGVAEPSARECELAGQPPFDARDYEAAIGVPPVGGEERFSPSERLGFRPTIEVNGIHSGYGGEGSKTIIPARAMAKLSARLVAGQDPKTCADLIANHLRRHAPAGLRLEVSPADGGGAALRLDPDSPLAAKARTVLDSLGLGETVFQWEGASIPIVGELARVAGAEPLLVGFGTEADRIHAPNESFSIAQFRAGFLYAGLMLAELGRG